MYQRILTVCTGNLCRSPLAEALLRLQLAKDGRDDAHVISAGVRSKPGKPVDDTMLYLARGNPALRTPLEAHRSQALNGHHTWWADVILVMDGQHAKQVLQVDPLAKRKIHLLGELTGAAIPDPYMKHESVYREVWGTVETAVLAWRERING